MQKAIAALSVTLCAALVASAAPKPAPAAAGAAPAHATHQPVKSNPVALSNMLAKTGGIIQTPAKGPAILFLNTQSKIPGAALREPVRQIEKLLRLPCVVRDQPSQEPVADAVKALSDASTAAVVVIGDTTSYPALLLAPESRWALVNVAPLAGAGVSADQLADRTQKELVRAFGMLLGSAYSAPDTCVLKPVLSPEDLDALKTKSLGVESLNKILSYAQRLGVKPSRMTTYRKAVEEGWAPAPTNEFQRAIWQELKK